jgi:hypothetical protein
MPENRPFRIFSASLAALLILFYFQTLTGQRSFFLGDITYYFEPLLRYAVDAIHQGRIPLWNPLSYCGMAQIAIPSPGLFYPPNWLFFFLPFNCAFALSMILHQLIAGIGMFLLSTFLGWAAIPSIIAGSAFALSGYMFGLQTNYTLVASAAWIPMAIWCLLSARWRKGNYFCAAAALCVFMMLAAGRPEVSGTGAVLLACVALAAAVHSHSLAEPDAVKRFYLLLTALFGGALLAMPIIVPTLEWLRASPRAVGLQSTEVLMWSTNWFDWLTIILPQPLGDPVPFYGSPYAMLASSKPGSHPFLNSAFLGPVLITLSLWGIFASHWIGKRFVLFIFAITVLLAAGDNTPFFPALLPIVPGLSVIRFPIKLLVFPVGCLCIFAADGMSRALRKELSIKDQWAPILFWTTLALISLAMFFSNEPSFFTVAKDMPFTPTGATILTAQHMLGQSGLLAAVAGLTICGLQYSYQQHHIGQKLFATVALVGVIASLAVYGFAFEHLTCDGDYFNQESSLKPILQKLMTEDHLDTSSCRTLALGVELPLQKMSPGVLQAHHQFERQHLRPNTHMDASLPSPFGYEAAATREYFAFASGLISRFNYGASKRDLVQQLDQHSPDDAVLCRFCQVSATKYIVMPAINRDVQGAFPMPRLNPNFFELAFEDAGTRIYRFKQFLPRAYFARHISFEPELKAVFHRFIDANPHSLQLDDETTTQSQLNADFMSQVKGSHPALSDRVELKKDDPETVVLQAHCAASELLVLADTPYPGWNALLDGKEVPIIRANICNRAICVPPGDHTIEFNYRPMSLIVGFVLCAAGALLIVGIQLLSSRSDATAPATSHTAPLKVTPQSSKRKKSKKKGRK